MPMPVHLVEDASCMRCLTGGTRHLVRAILTAYWLGECRRLPTTDNDLVRLADTDRGTWFRRRDDVRAALAEIVPKLDIARTAELEKKSNRIRAAKIAARASHAAKRNAVAPQLPHTLPEPPPEAVWRPATAQRYTGDGRTDMRARAQAQARNAGAAKGGMVEYSGDALRAGVETGGSVGVGGGGLSDSTPPQNQPTPYDLTSADLWTFTPTDAPPPELQQEAA